MTSTVRRAAAFALVGSLSVGIPLVAALEDPALATVAAAGPFLLVAGVALTIPRDSVVFELFARPGDRRDGTLYGLAGFSLAAAGLAIVAVQFGMPDYTYAGTIMLLAVGNLGGQYVRSVRTGPVLATAGFVTAGFLAGTGAEVVVVWLDGTAIGWPPLAFIAASGALLAALLREVLFQRDDPLVMATVALFLWLFASLSVPIAPVRIVAGLAVVVGLGYASYALETASVPGMLTGVLLSLLTIVLGDFGWFAMLVAFFGIGGLSTKFRYQKKRDRGIAEENEGARGTGNVLANSLVALLSVLGAAASSDLSIPPALFLFAFAGSLAAALADTLSSEIGGLFDEPRLITTFRVVEPGTDGAITWQGELAGVVGAALVAMIGWASLGTIGPAGAAVVFGAGVAGMTVDSLLGATVEGWLFGNQGVNLAGTLAAALVCGGVALAVGIVTL